MVHSATLRGKERKQKFRMDTVHFPLLLVGQGHYTRSHNKLLSALVITTASLCWSISYLSQVSLPFVLISVLLSLFDWLSSTGVLLPWSCCPQNYIGGHLLCCPLCSPDMDVAPHAQGSPEALPQVCVILSLSRKGNQNHVVAISRPIWLGCKLLWGLEDRKCIH